MFFALCGTTTWHNSLFALTISPLGTSKTVTLVTVVTLMLIDVDGRDAAVQFIEKNYSI